MGTYGDFGFFEKPMSGFASPQEHLNTLRAAAMERANYLSQMDRFYTQLHEMKREFNRTLGEQKSEFGQTLEQRKYEFEKNYSLGEEKLALERQGLAEQSSEFQQGLSFQKEQFATLQDRWRQEFAYGQGLDTWKRGYYESEQNRASESDWWTRGFEGVKALGGIADTTKTIMDLWA